MSVLQDLGARGDAVHDRSLYELRDDDRAGHDRETELLDPEGRGDAEYVERVTVSKTSLRLVAVRDNDKKNYKTVDMQRIKYLERIPGQRALGPRTEVSLSILILLIGLHLNLLNLWRRRVRHRSHSSIYMGIATAVFVLSHFYAIP